jgi:chromosomal replication initiation ATPase DnaA
MKTQNIQLSAKKTGYGNYDVTVYENQEVKGTFHTTDSQLIDDINEMNSDGSEQELIMFDSFNEIIEHCLRLI